MGFEKVVHLKKLYKVWFAIVIQVVFKVNDISNSFSLDSKTKIILKIYFKK